MVRWIVGVIRRWLKGPSLAEAAERVVIRPFHISPMRGMLRSVDRRLGYRKERTQAKNWKRRWRP
jgi:hypothetical protein